MKYGKSFEDVHILVLHYRLYFLCNTGLGEPSYFYIEAVFLLNGLMMGTFFLFGTYLRLVMSANFILNNQQNLSMYNFVFINGCYV